jgi:hypothetical protein
MIYGDDLLATLAVGYTKLESTVMPIDLGLSYFFRKLCFTLQT